MAALRGMADFRLVAGSVTFDEDYCSDGEISYELHAGRISVRQHQPCRHPRAARAQQQRFAADSVTPLARAAKAKVAPAVREECIDAGEPRKAAFGPAASRWGRLAEELMNERMMAAVFK